MNFLQSLMKHRNLLTAILAGSALLCTGLAHAVKPNFILIFTDDLGYADLGCYGSETIHTPNIDQLATQGRMLTSFVTASSVCTPSRAALLTGSYPKRVGMHQGVLFPGADRGLNPQEHTIADHLRAHGYATACFGKWHLGDDSAVLPTAQGFDAYFGIPYSNDMNHPDNSGKPPGGPGGMDRLWNDPESTLTKWNTPLMEGTEIVELPVDQRTITRRFTQRAIDFAKAHQEQPFFIYLPHSMPHIPLYVPDEVRNPDPEKAYINVIEHIDSEVGRLLEALNELDLAKRTYVIFTSDNGPWLRFKHHGGSAGLLRGGKMSTFEGGHRVPFIIRGPGVPSGVVCNELAATIDILPTIAALIERPLPKERIVDGLDMSELWTGAQETSPRDEFLYYDRRGRLDGIRQGEWKLLSLSISDGNGGDQSTVLLFDLENDPGEQNNVASINPGIVTRLKTRMQKLDSEISANARSPWRKKSSESLSLP